MINSKPSRAVGLRAGRHGMTLLEVIVAMAIFMMALAAIIPLMQMGQMRALEVQLQAFAMQKCQSKLAECQTGEQLLSSQNDVAFADNPPEEDWRWTLEANTTDVDNLWNVKVTVYRQLESGKIQVSLTQLVIDPAIRGGPTIVPPPTRPGG